MGTRRGYPAPEAGLLIPSIPERRCSAPWGERDYCNPTEYRAPSTDILYRNQGDGTFRYVSLEAGLHAAAGTGLGLAVADFDGDGRLDVYVANDGMPNVLWIQDEDGRFSDRALIAGCAVNAAGAPETSMDVQAVDLAVAGGWDLFVTHLRGETSTFYRNAGGLFHDDTHTTGLGTTSRPFTGFWMGFHDLDHDGELDLFVANGRVGLARPFHREDLPYAEPNQLFRGLGGARFEELAAELPPLVGTSRAAAFGDLDNDGDVDIVYLDLDGRVHLLRNDAEKRGSWIGLTLRDRRGRDALGAEVRVRAGGIERRRLTHTSYS